MLLRPFDPATDASLLPGLADLLVDAVENGASIGFMAGLTSADSLGFWTARAAAAERGEAVILVALGSVIDGAQAVAGTVSLGIAMPSNQLHRADVGKLIVGHNWQGKGLGARLMVAIEAEAAARGRTTLVLDTISGSPAARLYERCGWERIGEISDYALLPDGAMASTTVYSKRLKPRLRE